MTTITNAGTSLMFVNFYFDSVEGSFIHLCSEDQLALAEVEVYGGPSQNEDQ